MRKNDKPAGLLGIVDSADVDVGLVNDGIWTVEDAWL